MLSKRQKNLQHMLLQTLRPLIFLLVLKNSSDCLIVMNSAEKLVPHHNPNRNSDKEPAVKVMEPK